MNTEDLAIKLSEVSSLEGSTFECLPIPGDFDVLQITVNGIEELPVFLNVTSEQILCISYLFGEDEINADKRTDLLETMLEMNIPVPLSAFSKIGDRYVIFGALAVSSSFDDIVHELITLNENAVEALDVLSEYLQ